MRNKNKNIIWAKLAPGFPGGGLLKLNGNIGVTSRASNNLGRNLEVKLFLGGQNFAMRAKAFNRLLQDSVLTFDFASHVSCE